MKNKYIIKFKTTNNKKMMHEFTRYEDVKQIYLALQENLTVKSGKLYHIKENKKQLIEKFKKIIIGG